MRLHCIFASIYSYNLRFNVANQYLTQKNKRDFFIFLVLEVSAMVITGAVTITSMFLNDLNNDLCLSFCILDSHVP